MKMTLVISPENQVRLLKEVEAFELVKEYNKFKTDQETVQCIGRDTLEFRLIQVYKVIRDIARASKESNESNESIHSST